MECHPPISALLVGLSDMKQENVGISALTGRFELGQSSFRSPSPLPLVSPVCQYVLRGSAAADQIAGEVHTLHVAACLLL